VSQLQPNGTLTARKSNDDEHPTSMFPRLWFNTQAGGWLDLVPLIKGRASVTQQLCALASGRTMYATENQRIRTRIQKLK
jgi:hypothetical protein